jgi:putative membrane protein
MTGRENMMMYYYGPGMGSWMLVLMVLSNLVFWGLVAVGAVALVRFNRRARIKGSAGPVVTANELLAQRFARGEIDEDEYAHRSRVLAGVVSH